MAPSFVQAGTGVTITTGTAAVTLTGATVGNMVLLQVLIDGTGTLTQSSLTNLADLAGGTTAMTQITGGTNINVGTGAVAIQRVFAGRATGASVSISLSSSGDDIYARLYEFTGANTGTTTGDVFASVAAATVGDTAAVNDCGITTLGDERLALNFIAVNDDNQASMTSFTGETGGNWAEVAAAYGSSTGTDGAIQCQAATMAVAGTINGGSYTMAAADPWGIFGTQMIPQPKADEDDITIVYQQAVARGSLW